MKIDYKLSITSRKYYEKQRYAGETWGQAKKRIEEKRRRLAGLNGSELLLITK